ILTDISKAKANQIRTIDKKRIKCVIAVLPNGCMSEIEKAIKIHLDL
ncbi:PemK-like protein, partial [Candidatus Magnetoovum chiemensis]